MPEQKKKLNDEHKQPDMSKDTNHNLVGEKGGISDSDQDLDTDIVVDEEITYITELDPDTDEETVIIEDTEEIRN
jgi:hypothetical protein